MRYLSVCSGIEAATVAWHPLGWSPVAFAEIEAFPSAVLAHHYPHVPNWGDLTKFQEWPDATVNVLVGGTPCQSFSVAGLRAGMADPRGNLALVYLALAAKYRPRWLVWENVPGVLSSNGGRDFGSILGGMVELGYGFAYRVLDAQFFGVAQRRRRVFVVGCLGDWRRAAAVLFERASLSGHPAPRRETRESVAATLTAGVGNGGAGHGARSGHAKDSTLIVAPPIALCLNAGAMGRQDAESETLILTGGCFDVAHSLRADGFDASEDGTGRGTPLVPIAFGWQNSSQQGASASASEHCTPTLDKSKTPAIAFDTTQITSAANYSNPKAGGRCHPLAAGAHPPAVALAIRGRDGVPQIEMGDEVANAILTPNGGRGGIGVGATLQGMAVRRLTPRECERLQGFPDDYTAIPYRNKPAADGPRYKALGNSMAVPCMAWIGARIAVVASQRLEAAA